MEAVMMQYHGYSTHGFADAVTPCSMSPTNEQGRVSAAEWLRTAFHDMATADIALGIGGLDASLVFELDRGEDVGAAFNSSLVFFVNYYNARASMADLIALGIHTATRSCGGPFIPYRAGRVDAVTAGPLGVPQPQDSLESHMRRFQSAGFNTEDMIGLVACGHTIGGVHPKNFPKIVPPSSQSNVSDFDSTGTLFDNKVVTEYLGGCSSSPLVTGPNATNSDARIFASDGEVTMNTLADPAVFVYRCKALFERMINTVPEGVNLTEPIIPYEVKPVDVRLTVDGPSTLLFAGGIRVRTSVRKSTEISQVQIIYFDRDGGQSSCGSNECVVDTQIPPGGQNSSSIDETFTWFSFNTTIPSSSAVSSFKVYITRTDGTIEIYDNNGNNFPVQNQIFFQPSASCNTPIVKGSNSTQVTITIVAALYKSRLSLPGPVMKVTARRRRATIAYPELNTFVVKMDPWTGPGTPEIPPEYIWYTGLFEVYNIGLQGLSFDLVSGEGSSDVVIDDFRQPCGMQPEQCFLKPCTIA